MRQNKIIMRSLALLGALFFFGNSFAQISLSVNKQTIKKIIPQIEKSAVIVYSIQTNFPTLIQRKT